MRHWCPVRIGLLQAPLEVHGPEKWNRRLVIHGHLVIPTPVYSKKVALTYWPGILIKIPVFDPTYQTSHRK